jgi:hypothetical protein
VITLLVDANLDGHAELLDLRLRTDDWREFRDHLDIRFLHLNEVGLDRSTKDDVVWRLCQANGYYLLTSNRNLESEGSLEATIRREGTESSFPVFTLADDKRLYKSTAYLEQVVNALVVYLLDEANCRGTGRLYLP